MSERDSYILVRPSQSLSLKAEWNSGDMGFEGRGWGSCCKKRRKGVLSSIDVMVAVGDGKYWEGYRKYKHSVNCSLSTGSWTICVTRLKSPHKGVHSKVKCRLKYAEMQTSMLH